MHKLPFIGQHLLRSSTSAQRKPVDELSFEQFSLSFHLIYLLTISTMANLDNDDFVQAPDPHNEQCPGFGADVFSDRRQPLLDKGLALEDVVAALEAGWHVGHDARCELWDSALGHDDDNQQRDRSPSRLGSQPPRQVSMAPLPLPVLDLGRPDDVAPADPGPTNPADRVGGYSGIAKIQKPEIVFNSTERVPDSLTLVPAKYATQQVEKRLYVPLDYFTITGRTAAFDQGVQTATGENLKAETRSDGTLHLTTASAASPVKGIREDKDLSLHEIYDASILLEPIMRSHNYGEPVIKMFKDFFYAIFTHPSREDPLGAKALALYVDRIRKLFFHNLLLGEVQDISEINPQTLRNFAHTVSMTEQSKREQEIQKLLVRSPLLRCASPHPL